MDEERLEWVAVQPSEGDAVAAHRLMMRPRPVFRWLGILGVLVVALGIGLGVEKAWRVGHLPWGLWATFGGVVYLMAYLLVFLPWRVRNRFRKLGPLTRQFDFSFGDDGIRLKSEISSVIFPWSYVARWREDEKLILVYMTEANMPLGLPKRAFPREESLQDFRARLSRQAERVL